MPVFMVHKNWAGACFVKDLDFFESQGGRGCEGNGYVAIETETFNRSGASLAEALSAAKQFAKEKENG